jgi:hypothetical protein
MSSYDAKLNSPAGDAGAKQKHGGPGVEPSGQKGDNPATAGPGQTRVQSGTPENKEGHINPSAPEDSNATPGTTGDK